MVDNSLNFGDDNDDGDASLEEQATSCGADSDARANVAYKFEPAADADGGENACIAIGEIS